MYILFILLKTKVKTVTMGKTCCAPGCKSGYPNQPKDPNVSFHHFPKEDSQNKAWIQAIPRAN